MRISPIVRLFALIGGLTALGVSVYLFWISNQTEAAYVFAQPLDQYTFIANNEEFLTRIEVPAQRDFTVITDPNQIVGRYTGQPVEASQLVQAELLVDAPPAGRRQFANGLLPVGTSAYPLVLANQISAVLQPDDLIDIIVLVNEDGEPTPDDSATVLFQKIPVLGIEEDGTILVAMTYTQIAVYEGFTEVEGARFTAAINQSANGDYPALHTEQLYPDYSTETIRSQFAVPTPTPQPEPVPAVSEGEESDGVETAENN